MYAQLLDSALRERTQPSLGTTPAKRLAELLRCRNRLTVSASSDGQSDGAEVTVVDQLSYDIALIDFARGMGVELDLQAFDQPQVERDRLEQALVSRGIRLDRLNE
jgi:hypothetical protein